MRQLILQTPRGWGKGSLAWAPLPTKGRHFWDSSTIRFGIKFRRQAGRSRDLGILVQRRASKAGLRQLVAVVGEVHKMLHT